METAEADGRILLLIEGKGNRQQIAKQLEERYRLLHPNHEQLPTGGFDLAIVDGPGLRKWQDALAQAKLAEQPVFLPVMLILPRSELRNRIKGFSAFFDDFATSPIDRIEFLERVAILLRARFQSVEQREELVRAVNYDRTSGLPNRYLFAYQVQSSLRIAEARDLRLFVLVIHLPLTTILETFGEQALESVAGRYSARLGEVLDKDVGVARLGIDSWGVRLPADATIDRVIELCARIHRLATEPMQVADEALHLPSRIGVASFPDDAASATELIDTAIAASSGAHDSEPAFYSPELKEKALHYLRTETKLHHALEQEQFELWLQPKLALQDGQVTAAEALIRWRLPSGELVSPGDFIPVAETCGFIRQITRWVIKTTIATAAEWRQRDGSELHLAVNITPVDVQQPDFLSWLTDLCTEHDVPPRVIELELTETMLCNMDDATLDRLRALRDNGFTIAIDDFGTGYSSLGYLHQLPAHTLKIDKCFIDGVPNEPRAAVLTQVIINLARQFGLSLVAEGIENSEQLEYLSRAGVDFGQGFHISRPLPAKEFRGWVQQWGRTHLGV